MKIEKVVDKLDRKRLINIFTKYRKFTTVSGLGSGWWGEVMSYFPVRSWLGAVSTVQIILWGLKDTHLILLGIPVYMVGYIPVWMIFIYYIVKFYVWILGNWAIGKIGIKAGLLKAQAQVGTKIEELNPVQVETFDQYHEYTKVLNALAEKMGIKERVENKITKI